ncbi:MAG: hypothetical protein HY685_06245 [Chloroflexi bacterium]|nr:hypothetical protein [Chloroflexota bacterium]
MPNLLLWWGALQLLGLLVFPLLLPVIRLPDRGYAFAKPIGLLLVSFGFWAAVITGLVPSAASTLLAVLLLLAIACAASLWVQREELLLLLRYERGLLIAEEAVFTGAFLLFVAFRALAPDVHLTTVLGTGLTTEQPMDLAFLASSLRSDSFPPADPWLSGSSISYYYFGYVMVSVLARLALVPATVAYNLGLATFFGLAAIAAFGLAANAVRLSGFTRLGRSALLRLQIFAGLVAAVLVLLAGNFVGTLELVRAWGWGSADFWDWLNIPQMRGAPFGGSLLPQGDSWYWHASRVIVDGTYADPIDEVPAFSFALGDLHPHLMAIPFDLVALGLGLAWLARSSAPDWRWPFRQPGETALLAVAFGALGFINSWDLPTFLSFLVAAIALRRAAEGGRLLGLVQDIAVPGLVVSSLAVVLYLPFYLNFASQARGFLPVVETGTRPVHYLLLWGPLLAAVFAFAVASAQSAWRTVPRSWLFFSFAVALLPFFVWALLGPGLLALGNLLGEAAASEGTRAVGQALGSFADRSLLLTLPIGVAVCALLGLSPQTATPDRAGRTFLGLVVVFAALLMMGPELFYVADLFGTRMNTAFKLHYQAWLLLAVAAAIGIAWLATGPWPRDPRKRLRRWAGGGWLAVALLFATIALPYGPLALGTRVAASPSSSAALDGLASLRRTFPAEIEATEWLRDKAPPGSVLLEAKGDDYSDYGRVSAITGIPTLLGWSGHEDQWRGSGAPQEGRPEAVEAIYRSAPPLQAVELLRLYGVDYVYVGRLERERYGPQVVERLQGFLPIEHMAGDVFIFGVPGG